MNRIINKRQAVCGTVWMIVLCIVLSLWPLRLVNETVVSGSNKQMVMESEAVTSDYVVKQMFIAQYDKLKNIDIYFAEGTVGSEFNFVLYDAAMNMIMQQVISTKSMEQIPGYCTVQVNIDTQVGKEYYYLVQGLESEFRVAYENTEECGNIYNGTLYYGDVEDTEHCMIAEYDYEVPLRKGKTLVCDAILVLFAGAVTYLTGIYYRKKPERNTLLTVERVCKAVMNPAIIAAGAAACIAVYPCRLFTEDRVSIVFYEVSIVLAVAVLLYAVNHSRTGYATDRSFCAIVGGKWKDYLQAAMFAGALWACCNYMNGLYEIHHTVAYRQMLIFFALAVVVSYQRAELFHWVNLVYVAAAAVIGRLYYENAMAALENPEELEYQVVRLTAWAGILAGFVLVNVLKDLFRGKIKRVSAGYGMLVALFFALIIVYRNTRGWPIYLVCAFTLFYLRMGAWHNRARLLQNLCNGILLHFGAMVIYCLLHRPYMFYQYYRYPFIFHTVTISAVYLSLVVCAAMVKFLDSYRRRPSLAGSYKELILLGISAVYLLFTLSRTGYLAVLAMAVVMIPVSCLAGRGRWRRILQSTGMMIAAAAVCFPIVFTAQRIIPSVAADPILHEIEELPVEIVHGRVMDSNYYITIQRFVQVFQMKVLGIPEERCVEAICIVREDGEPAYINSYFKNGTEVLLASEEEMAPEEEAQEDSYANGRMEIFALYYQNLNKTGHEDMGIMEPDGTFTVHAHNIYLQVAYDHGIYVGIVFILLGAGTLVQAAVYYHRRREDTVCAAFPLAVLILFAVAGLTEWIFHPCCPIAYCLLAALAPLLVDMRREKE
ncbi:MAG: DUF3488 domain-containing protein [Clostridiales bacterium]|nr:DUF3488 domain-containing protein [Clostridiales bacterium]